MSPRALKSTPSCWAPHFFPKAAPLNLSRLRRWWRSWAVPGMGMFVEAWMIFSIG